MAKIQLDMFEVGKAAAILIQCELEDGRTVRLLADGGGDDKPKHVANKLSKLFSPTNTDPLHIDLMVGTHYDGDHLGGLIPIARESKFSIGETWLPPINNDADDSKTTLVQQLEKDDKSKVLSEYVNFQLSVADQAERFQQEWTKNSRNKYGYEDISEFTKSRQDQTIPEDLYKLVDGDEAEIEEMCRHLNAPIETGSFPKIEGELIRGATLFGPEVKDIVANASKTEQEFVDFRSLDEFKVSNINDLDVYKNLYATAGLIRKAAGENAITASFLRDLVAELKSRKLTIKNHQITKGSPKYFVWDANESGQFDEVDQPAYRAATNPKLCLLGPSSWLVQKPVHWEKLPLWESITKSAFPNLNHISPSNQLSYSFVFEYAGQRVLISGDSGFSDFYNGKKDHFFQDLLDELKKLHVVQISHHGGGAHNFYRVLDKAGFISDKETDSYYLLSHGVDDDKRPNDNFGIFATKTKNNGKQARLLFTSRPLATMVESYRDMIAPRVPKTGPVEKVGDVRLIYVEGKWEIKKHAIDPFS